MSAFPALLPLVSADGPAFFRPCPRCASPARSGRDVVVNIFDAGDARGCCSLCAPPAGRQLLQIRRSSYHDVVKVADLTKLAPGALDGVQSYVINASRVAFLKRRPQPRAPKGAVGASRCGVCARHLQDVSAFCSLQCKLDADAAGGADAAAASLPPASPAGDAADAAAGGRYRGGAPAWPRGGGTGLASIIVPGKGDAAAADNDDDSSSTGRGTPRRRRSPSTPTDGTAASAPPARRRRPPAALTAAALLADDSTADGSTGGGDSDDTAAASKRRKVSAPSRAWLD